MSKTTSLARLWAAGAVVAALLMTGTLSAAQAAAPTKPAAPTANDRCGVSQDQVFTPNGQPGEEVSWQDSLGNYYGAGKWNSSYGAVSVTLTATVYTADGTASYTYPALTFGTESDTSCVQAPDTVTASVGACDPQYGGRSVTFTYTNIADTTGWFATDPILSVKRSDDPSSGMPVYFDAAGTTPIPDGGSLTVTSGDHPEISYLTIPLVGPGTNYLSLRTAQTAQHPLPNTIVVPECPNTFAWYPYGDPLVGRPKAAIGRCRNGQVRVTLDSRNAVGPVVHDITNFPRGRYRHRLVTVAPGSVVKLLLRHQRTGKMVYVMPHLDSLPNNRRFLAQRRLRC